MKTKLNKLLHGFTSFIVISLSISFAHADDTEIFFGNPSGNGIIPNILFILDNSGSMSSLVSTYDPYDPTINYYAPSSFINNNYIYAFNPGAFSNGQYRGGFLGRLVSANTTCKVMTDSLTRNGQYLSAQVSSYSSGKWRNVLRSSGDDSSTTECKADRGVHGATVNSPKKYAQAGTSTQMWTSIESNEIVWSSIALREYYSANYLNWFFYNRNVISSYPRIDIMKNVVNSLVDSTSGINIGLMSFNTNNGGKQGGRVNEPISYIESNRASFKLKLNSLTPATWTPLSETLFEAQHYYEGTSVFLGSQSVSSSINSGKYISPVTSECQPNNIVLLTDGEPSYDADPTSYAYDPNLDAASRAAIESKVGNCTGNCLDEISKYMQDNSLNVKGLSHAQNVNTYTIGFNINDPLLKATAEGDGTPTNIGGGGKYFTANNTSQLETALKSILGNIKSISTTFVSPGVSVNTFNRLNHRSELYFSVFKPELNPEWSGNLKRYRLGSDGVIYDMASAAAVDKNTGFFKDTAQSWWSSTQDGAKVGLGGAASNLPSTNTDRHVYTYLAGNSKALTDASNDISVANISKLTKTLLNIPSATSAEHQALINWIRGIDSKDSNGDGSKTDSRKVISDPLHSAPVVVIYGGTDTNPDSTIFYGDNQGFIHAVNGKNTSQSGYGNSGGEEYFSFIPEELLKNQITLFNNSPSSAHPYGMDGSITSWVHDDNADNQISGANDFVYLYAGMRRGGNSYYALDATNRTAPSLLWEIHGGANGTAGFTELGQSWSRPVKTKIKVNSTVKDVLIFAGGYDTHQDSATSRSADSIGRAVYIVDAKTGSLIWSGGPNSSSATKKFTDMKYSIPSNIKVIDVNGDKQADQMYVGDMGGQVWRFDINNGQSGNTLVDGAVIADLAGNTPATNRRFYHEPDLSVIEDGGRRKLAIAIGSGWQAHPLSTAVQDKFYMIKDPNLMDKPGDLNNDNVPDYVKNTELDLYDATDNRLGQVSAINTLAQQTLAYLNLGSKHGWFVSFSNPGEKSLASSLTVNGEIYFTTYEPTPSSLSCSASSGTPRLYRVNLAKATPVKNYDGIGLDTELTSPDRVVTDINGKNLLKTSSLPTTPQRLRVDGHDQLCVGTECNPLSSSQSILGTYWIEEQ